MAIYLDDTQRNTLAGLATGWTWRSQWPTWLLIVSIYSGWFGVAYHARMLGLPLTTLLLIVLGTWYMSLQHELLHGHPTRSPFVNGLLGFAPLAVWFPYRIYRESHLRHHDDAHLTHADVDPESYFVSERTWLTAGPVIRALLAWRNTFFGRLLVGPAFAIAATLAEAFSKFRRGDLSDLPAWLAHGVALGLLTFWLQQVCAIPAWVFIFGVGYGALSLGSVRSFHEHRVASEPAHRTVINEAAWGWRLLFEQQLSCCAPRLAACAVVRVEGGLRDIPPAIRYALRRLSGKGLQRMDQMLCVHCRRSSGGGQRFRYSPRKSACFRPFCG
jgi:fatty acid desaturase